MVNTLNLHSGNDQGDVKTLENKTISEPHTSQGTSMLQLYVENIHDSNVGGFTIPMPTTLEKLQPFLDETEITGWQDMRIWEIKSGIKGLGDVMYDYVAKAMSPELFDELNFLAAKLSGISGYQKAHFAELKMNMEAVIESKQHCSSIADIINLSENLFSFMVMPAFEPSMLGDVYLDMDIDTHYDAIGILRSSDDRQLNELADYIVKLEEHVDVKAYGKSIQKEQDGIFTENGYLAWQGDEFQTPYQGAQDIPVEYRVFSNSDEISSPLLKVMDVDMAETMVKLHAVCDDYMYTSHSLKTLLTRECNDCLISVGSFGVRLFDAMDAYKRGSEAFKVLTADESFRVRNMPQRVFAVNTLDFKDSDVSTIKGNFVEMNAKALSESIRRHAVAPSLMDTVQADGSQKSYDLLAWAELQQHKRDAIQSHTLRYPEEVVRTAQFRFSTLRDDCSAACKTIDVCELLMELNTSFMTKAQNLQPDMLRIANIAAKELLVRGDIDTYKLTPNGSVRMSVTEALNPQNFSIGYEFAIKISDVGNLEKWAQSTARDIVKKLEQIGCNEQKKSHKIEL